MNFGLVKNETWLEIPESGEIMSEGLIECLLCHCTCLAYCPSACSIHIVL